MFKGALVKLSCAFQVALMAQRHSEVNRTNERMRVVLAESRAITLERPLADVLRRDEITRVAQVDRMGQRCSHGISVLLTIEEPHPAKGFSGKSQRTIVVTVLTTRHGEIQLVRRGARVVRSETRSERFCEL